MLTNFRDIGNIPVATGTLKGNYFYRSGELTNLSNEDQSFLKETCSINKIFDFRSKEEIKTQPDTSIKGISIENIDILQSTSTASVAELNNMLDINSEEIEKYMLETYTSLITSDSALEGYRKFLMEVVSEDKPLVFHCFAGKDRTGVGAALLLKIAGATDEQILSDYLQTNKERVSANKEIISSLGSTLNEDQIKALNIALLVDKKYLIHAKETLEKTYGSFEKYLIDGLHLDKDYTNEFRKKFVID